jgi:hypothetical protein
MIAGMIMGGAALALWFRPPPPAADKPLDGKLIVYVRPPERASEPQPVEQEGATPVRTGGNMSLEAQLNQPAFAYFVWLDAGGKALPLYPWNSQSLEVTDLREPPPERRATNVVYSPLLGSGWNFGEQTGTETVLLLVRRTPLGKDIQLADLISLPASAAEPPISASTYGWNSGADSVTVLHPASAGDSAAKLPADDPLAALVLKLGKHFELIRAARFAHQ